MLQSTSSVLASSSVVALAPLTARPDQPQQWLTHERDPISFDAARAIVLEGIAADGFRSDTVADLRAWRFGPSEDLRSMQIERAVGDSGARPLVLRKRAFAQLAERTEVPAAYISTLPAKLQTACVNFALARISEREPAMLRLAGDEVRAIMSQRYAPLDDAQLLEITHDALTRAGLRDTARVRSTVYGPHTVLRITMPDQGVAVKAGDVIEWGFDLGNSELGLRSVQVTPCTYRLICTNGMRAWKSEAATRLPHRGDHRRLRQSLVEVIPTALAEAQGHLKSWKRSVDVMIDDALEEIEALRGFGLQAGESRAIGRRLLSLPETTPNEKLSESLKHTRSTVFDVANAITEVARDRTDVAARLELEETGYRYLTRRTR
jgi:hypothetical protein